jgi:hypothetical protein
MVSRCASLRFSLRGRGMRYRCLLLANATFGRETTDVASDAEGSSSFQWEKSVGLSIALQAG